MSFNIFAVSIGVYFINEINIISYGTTKYEHTLPLAIIFFEASIYQITMKALP